MILLIFAEAGLALTRRPMTASDVQCNDRNPRVIPFAHVFFSVGLIREINYSGIKIVFKHYMRCRGGTVYIRLLSHSLSMTVVILDYQSILRAVIDIRYRLLQMMLSL